MMLVAVLLFIVRMKIPRMRKRLKLVGMVMPLMMMRL